MLDSIFIGYDPRPEEIQGYAVARSSIRRRLTLPVPIRPLILSQLQSCGLYKRPIMRQQNRLWDVISDAPMSTEFAISRFLVPHIAKHGYALFVDADVMARNNVLRIFDVIDKSKAISVVKHDHRPSEQLKMDNQIQTSYSRKNWSSVMVFNCDHPKVRALTPDIVNKSKGLWLHQFGWLDDGDIGEIPAGWNHLVGYSPQNMDAQLVHFTSGVPSMQDHDQDEFADEWFDELERWAS